MVRAPCCEKMGIKKGPWTTEEDKMLISYIRQHGHGNWRALPKLAGLLRCGKSCRLRWTNYLRPDIKRGNFSNEEEETIIKLHESLGNRWSAIAARLPGRTDNEIKNVWHTHLKKKLKNHHQTASNTSVTMPKCDFTHVPPTQSHPLELSLPQHFPSQQGTESTPGCAPVSPQQSSGELSSLAIPTVPPNNLVTKDDLVAASQTFHQSSGTSQELYAVDQNSQWQLDAGDLQLQLPLSPVGEHVDIDDMEFWYNLLTGAGAQPEF